MKWTKALLAVSIILSLVFILAVSWHSVEEIHYLKSFYPAKFTVEDAYYASWVELIKVHIIAMPLVLIIVLCLYLLRAYFSER